jgi:hypothetical protein
MYDLPISVFCKNCETYGRPTKEELQDKVPYRCHKCGKTSRPFSGEKDRIVAAFSSPGSKAV